MSANVIPIIDRLRQMIRKQKLLELLNQGVDAWNLWRKRNPDLRLNLYGAQLEGAQLSGINFRHVVLNRANLRKAELHGADFRSSALQQTNFSESIMEFAQFENAVIRGADLTHAILNRADMKFSLLSRAKLNGAKMVEADMRGVSLRRADLRNAQFERAILRHASMVECDIEGANFEGAEIYGISAWSVRGEPENQKGLIIRPTYEDPALIVDNLEVAQFVYLLRENKKIRDVLNAITSKAVLILGRFSPERKKILELLRTELRERGYIPIIFDFERARDLDFTETVATLAGMCRFVIADITNPRSSPLELQATIPNYMVPFIPILQENEKPFPMFVDLVNKYDWVLDPLTYTSGDDLSDVFNKAILIPANEMQEKLAVKKAQELKLRSTRDYV